MKALVYLESAKKPLEERPEPKNTASTDVIGAGPAAPKAKTNLSIAASTP